MSHMLKVDNQLVYLADPENATDDVETFTRQVRALNDQIIDLLSDAEFEVAANALINVAAKFIMVTSPVTDGAPAGFEMFVNYLARSIQLNQEANAEPEGGVN